MPKRSRFRCILKSIASVFARIVVATIAGVAAYAVGLLFMRGISRGYPGMRTNMGVAGVVIASVASGLTFYLFSPLPLRRKMPFRYIVPRHERATCLWVTVPLFCGLLFVAPFVLEEAAYSIWRSDFISSVGSSETLNMIALLALSFLFPYLTARVVYGRLRWRQVASADPLCPNCLYDLTGNTSGICPECGTPIPEGTQDELTANPPKQ